MTGLEILATKEKLESSAATLLGRLLFAFSRLETNLSLCLVWVNGGENLDLLSDRVAEFNFHSKLERLSIEIEKKFLQGSESRIAYQAWLERAQLIRRQRNEFVHGRWGVDASSNQVVNVLGIPTSSSQREVRYTLGELETVNDEADQLLEDLLALSTRWPI